MAIIAKLSRFDLQNLAGTRVKEAKVLLDSRQFQGAYYLLVYVVECPLKACIAIQIKRFDFPDKKIVDDSYIHNLLKLLDISGLKVKFENNKKANHDLEVNWNGVKNYEGIRD